MSILAKTFVGISLIAIALPTMASAADRQDAQVAIIEAQAKIETGDKVGFNLPAPDVHARARAALAEARHEYRKHHNGRALAAAERASALVDLALATAEARDSDARRQVAIAASRE
jgi:hypothetical protein